MWVGVRWYGVVLFPKNKRIITHHHLAIAPLNYSASPPKSHIFFPSPQTPPQPCRNRVVPKRRLGMRLAKRRLANLNPCLSPLSSVYSVVPKLCLGMPPREALLRTLIKLPIPPIVTQSKKVVIKSPLSPTLKRERVPQMLKPILAKTAAAALAAAAVLVLPAAVADQNSAKDQNGDPCLKINCEGGTIENHCDRPVNFAACHAESRSGCLLNIKSGAQIAPKESLPFACKPGNLAQADGCFPPFVPVSFSALQSGCIPDPENPDALTAAAAASTAPQSSPVPQAPKTAPPPEPAAAAPEPAPPPAGTPTENALRKCNAWPGQLSANATANTEGNETVFHKDWKCKWLLTETHLHIAAMMNDSNSARWLIANGADVNAKNNFLNRTPLHHAARQNAPETAALLLKNGADVHAKSNIGWTPLHLAAIYNAPETAPLLLKNGADVNAKDIFDQTPLHYAAQENATETAALLLKNGADVHAKSEDGSTPLDWAIVHNHSEMQSLLKRHGGRCNEWC